MAATTQRTNTFFDVTHLSTAEAEKIACDFIRKGLRPLTHCAICVELSKLETSQETSEMSKKLTNTLHALTYPSAAEAEKIACDFIRKGFHPLTRSAICVELSKLETSQETSEMSKNTH